MPVDAENLELVIEDMLKGLSEPKNVRAVKDGKGNALEGIPFFTVDRKAAAELKKNKNYAARCKALARKYGCDFCEQLNGDFMFSKFAAYLRGIAPSSKSRKTGSKEKKNRYRTKKAEPTEVLELRPTVTNSKLWKPNRPPKSEWERLRKSVLERDDHTCQFCGHRASKWMNIHHVKDSSDNNLNNLITTCVACHAILHIGRSLALGIIEIWKSEVSQVDIVRRTRSEILAGKTLAEIKAQLPLKATKLLPGSTDHAANLLSRIGDGETVSLAKPLCAVFVNLTRWQLQ